MRILFLTHRLPFPPNKGDKIRSHHILSYLVRRHEVHLACTVDDVADLEHIPVLRERVASLHYVRIDGLAAKLRRPWALVTGKAISVRAFYSRSLQRQIDTLLDIQPFDAIFGFSSPMAEYVFRSRHWHAGLRHTKRVMDLIDVDSAKWAEYASRSSGWRKVIYKRESRLLAQYETSIIQQFDKTYLVSAAERRSLPAAVNCERVTPLPNGVDAEYFAPLPPAPDDASPHVVFTGVMDYWPNVEGVQWFVKEVWPLVRARHPDACFDIVGSRPTNAVRALAQVAGVTVTGFVPDVRPYIGKARVCVAPLRIARGVQNKVLEAMAMARAVVCTPQAMEGIGSPDNSSTQTPTTALEFAARVNEFLNDRAFAISRGEEGREYVRRHHQWQSTLAPLAALFP